MKESLLQSFRQEDREIHGCYKPDGGPCFYIRSVVDKSDYDFRASRTFEIFVENGEVLTPLRTLTLEISKGAFSNRRLFKMGDVQNFLRVSGLRRVRESLDRDWEKTEPERIELTRNSPEWEFDLPSLDLDVAIYRKLKGQIVSTLAGLHAQGRSHVTKADLLGHLGADLALVDRALNDLVELQLLKDLNKAAGMSLTATGRQQAEDGALLRLRYQSRPTIRRFDFFVSHAGEDAELARAIASELEQRGFGVWIDNNELSLGDQLVNRLNAGLAESRFGIVLISQAFLAKPWTDAELAALQHRSIVSGQKTVLPILHGVAHRELAEKHPLLANTISAEYRGNLLEIVDQIVRAIQSAGPARDA